MKNIIYFFQFIFISLFFLIFKFLRLKLSSAIGGKLFQIVGPIFRSNKLIRENIKKALPQLNNEEIKKINKQMWNNYGRIFSEYMFLKNFRYNLNQSNITIHGQEILDEIKKSNTPVIFVSGHFSNFELMAMHIEKSGIKLAAIYRPLNNNYLVFSGIGNHKTFISMLKEYRFKIMKDLEFSDHYNFTDRDLDKIINLAETLNCKVITTEKDFLRLGDKDKKKIKYIKSELKIINEEKLLSLLV